MNTKFLIVNFLLFMTGIGLGGYWSLSQDDQSSQVWSEPITLQAGDQRQQHLQRCYHKWDQNSLLFRLDDSLYRMHDIPFAYQLRFSKSYDLAYKKRKEYIEGLLLRVIKAQQSGKGLYANWDIKQDQLFASEQEKLRNHLYDQNHVNWLLPASCPPKLSLPKLFRPVLNQQSITNEVWFLTQQDCSDCAKRWHELSISLQRLTSGLALTIIPELRTPADNLSFTHFSCIQQQDQLLAIKFHGHSYESVKTQVKDVRTWLQLALENRSESVWSWPKFDQCLESRDNREKIAYLEQIADIIASMRPALFLNGRYVLSAFSEGGFDWPLQQLVLSH